MLRLPVVVCRGLGVALIERKTCAIRVCTMKRIVSFLLDGIGNLTRCKAVIALFNALRFDLRRVRETRK